MAMITLPLAQVTCDRCACAGPSGVDRAAVLREALAVGWTAVYETHLCPACGEADPAEIVEGGQA